MLDVATALGLVVTAFVDERCVGTIVRDLPVVDPHEVENSAEYPIGIADPRVRARFADLLDSRGAGAKDARPPDGRGSPRDVIRVRELGHGYRARLQQRHSRTALPGAVRRDRGSRHDDGIVRDRVPWCERLRLRRPGRGGDGWAAARVLQGRS